MSDLPKCYKCGEYIADDFPSHFCKNCRAKLNAPEINLADRLNENDLKLLLAMRIKVDADLIKKT